MHGAFVTLGDLVSGPVVTINSTDTVAAAIRVLRETRLKGLPVVTGGRLVGFVTPLQLLGESPDRVIAEVMQSGVEPGTPAMLPGEAYRLLVRQGLDLLPVTDDDRVTGMVAPTAILEALKQQTDSLTGLPWAMSLRTWACRILTDGKEIAIIFIDLDNFGLVNKVCGHVVGDDCLSTIARMLVACVDRRFDTLCRYGGDEFAIGTIRQTLDAEALARRVRDTINLPVDLNGARRHVRASVGVAGGRRMRRRTDVHVASLVEDLIAEASLASTLAKGLTRSEGIPHRNDNPVAAD